MAESSANRTPPPPGRGARQQRLSLARAFAPRREDFVVTAANAAAAAAVDAWPAWPGGLLALVGPEGSGKTHLARAWAARAGAEPFPRHGMDWSAPRGRPILLEDADLHVPDDDLFHVINVAEPGHGLLLTSRRDPRAWPARLPDLRSRLAGLPTARLGPPDDAILDAVLRKLFRERNIEPPAEVVAYLMRRIERSIPAAREIVNRIDELAAAERRDVTRALAREIVDPDDRTLGLFD